MLLAVYWWWCLWKVLNGAGSLLVVVFVEGFKCCWQSTGGGVCGRF